LTVSDPLPESFFASGLFDALFASCVEAVVALPPFAGNADLFGSACVPRCRGMYIPAAIITPTPINTPIASHTPRLELGRAAGGDGRTPAGGVAALIGAVTGDGVGMGAGVGREGAGVGATRGVSGVSINVVAPVDFDAGVAVRVVSAAGNSLTGTLPSAARKASAD